MKRIFSFIFLAALLVTSCYKDEFTQLENEMKNLRNAQIAPLEDQVSKIAESLTTINALSSELKEYIETLEGTSGDLQDNISEVNGYIDELRSALSQHTDVAQAEVLSHLEAVKSSLEVQITNVNSALDVLKDKYDSLQKQTDDLKAYSEDKFAKKDWVEGTFATIDAQNAIIADVKDVSKLISGLTSSTYSIGEGIKTYIEEEVSQVRNNGHDDIIKLVSDITDRYNALIKETSDKITSAYTTGLQDAISKTEMKVMDWVYSELDDYYKVADANAQILVFKTLIGNVPEGKSLQGQIDELSGEIASLTGNIGEAYAEAIEKAIKESEGKLKGDFDERILSLRTNELKSVTDKVSELEEAVKGIWATLTSLGNRITTLEQQIASIQKSLIILSDLQYTLKQYMDEFENSMKSKDAAESQHLKELISALDAAANGQDANSLQSRIDALRAYVGTIPKGVSASSITSWVENSIKTMTEALKTYATLDAVKGLTDVIDNTCDDHDRRLGIISTRLDSAIADARTTVDSWISEKLAEYYTAAEINGKVKALDTDLKTLFSDGDKDLSEQISTLNSRIQSIIEDLTKDYEAAIELAITSFNGFVDDSVAEKVSETSGRFEALDAQFIVLEGILTGIEDNVDDLNVRIGKLNHSIDSLNTVVKGYDALSEIVAGLSTKFNALSGKYGSFEQFKEIYKDIYGKEYGSEGEGTGGYVDAINKLSELAANIELAETTISNFKSLVGESALKDSDLNTTLSKVVEDLNALKISVIGSESDSGVLRSRLDFIGSQVDSISNLLSPLENKLLSEVLPYSSIAYIPTRTDGKAVFKAGLGNSFSGRMEYEVRPKSIAKIVANNAKFKYLSTETRAWSPSFTEATIENISGDDTDGTIRADIRISDGDAVAYGVSLAMFVSGDGYDFVSDFVPINTSAVSNNIFVEPSSWMSEDPYGDEITVFVYYPDDGTRFSVSSRDNWINVTDNNDAAQLSGSPLYMRTVKITLDPTTSSSSRSGSVTFSIRLSGQTKTCTLEVTQAGRPPQTFDQFIPASGTINFSWNGRVLDDQMNVTEETSRDISVVTNDLAAGWTAALSNTNWANINTVTSGGDQKVRLSIRNNQNNTSNSPRTGTIVFTSVTGVTENYTFTQQPRMVTSIASIDPMPVLISYDGQKYATAEDITPTDTTWRQLSHHTPSSSIFGDRDDYYYLQMTLETEDGSTDWTPSVNQSGWEVSKSSSTSKVFTLRTAADGSAEKDVTVTFRVANIGEIGTMTVKQLKRKATTVKTEDPHYMFSYDASKYKDYTEEEGSWTSISNSRIDYITVETGDGSTDWSVTSDQTWLTAVNNNGSLRLTASRNQTTEAREATVTFTCLSQIEGEEMVWTVKQEASPAQTFTFAKYNSTSANNNIYIGEDGMIHIKNTGCSNSQWMYVYVTGEPNNDWTLSIDSDWLSRNSSNTSSGRGGRYTDNNRRTYIQLRAGANTGVERVQTITFTVGGVTYDYNVYQDSRDTYEFSSFTGSQEFDYKAQNSSITVTTNPSNNTDWKVKVLDMEDNEVTAQDYWLKATTADNSSTASLTMSRYYPGDEPRQAQLLFYTFEGEEAESAQKITITQNPRGPQTFTAPLEEEFEYSFVAQSDKVIPVTTSDEETDWSYEVDSNASSWLTVGVNADHTGLVLNLSANDAEEASLRSGTITLKPYDENIENVKVITVKQKAPEVITLSFNETSWEPGFQAGSKNIGVTSSLPGFTDWEVQVTGEDSDWLTVEKNDNGGVTLSAAANSSSDPRTASVEFVSSSTYLTGTNTVSVTQAAFSQTITVNPSPIIISANGQKYLNASGGWSNRQYFNRVYVMDVASVTVTPDNSWSVSNDTWTRTTTTKSGSNIRMTCPSAITSWTDERVHGTILVYNDAGSQSVDVYQNRPLTVTGDPSSIQVDNNNSSATFSITIKSDSKWIVSGLNNNATSSDMVNNTKYDAGETTVSVTFKYRTGGTTISIKNDEGEQYNVTATGSYSSRKYRISLSVRKQ